MKHLVRSSRTKDWPLETRSWLRWLMRAGTVLAMLLALVQPSTATTPRREVGQPLLTAFSVKDYGAHAQNWAVLQDQRGLIYVGNGDGVLEFDGREWRLIPVANRTMVRSLALAADGRIYVGAVGEIGYLQTDAQGQRHYHSLLAQLPEAERAFGDVWRTFALDDGVYFYSDERLLRVAGNEVRSWPSQAGFFLAYAVGQRLFVHELGRGLQELRDDRLQLLPGGERWAQERIYAMLDGGDAGALLVATRSQGFQTFRNRQFQHWPTEADAELARDLIYNVQRLPDGRLLIGTLQGGATLLDPQGRVLERIDGSAGLPSATVLATAVDRQHGLWLGLDNGLARIEASGRLSTFADARGLAGRVIALRRHQGKLYAATGNGLFMLAAGSTARFVAIAGIRSQTWDLLSDSDRLLVANNEGVFAVEDGQARMLRPSSDHSLALHASRRHPGRLYIGLKQGVAVMTRVGEQWRDDGVLPEVGDEIHSIHELDDGRLWLGTQSSGVLRVSFAEQGDRLQVVGIERFGSADGLPDLNANFVRAIAGQPLFSTLHGLFRFDELQRRFRPEPHFAALFEPGPRTVGRPVLGPDGRVWLATRDAGSRIDEKGAAVPLPDGGYRWQAQALAALSPSNLAALLAEPDGVVWYGGADGLFRYDERVVSDFGQTFATLIRQVSADGGALLLGDSGGRAGDALRVNAGQRLRFEYAASSFDGRDANRFQVRLDGQDVDWSPWTDEPYIDYANLWEGDYRFRVRASNLYGVIGEEAAFDFRVLPPWYRTTWAWLVYLLWLAGTLWGLLRWRVASLARERQRLLMLVDQRTAELGQALARTRQHEAELIENERELLAAQQAEQQARFEAEAANAAKSRFLATMSHELRTPLNAIIGFTRLVKRKGAELLPERQLENLDKVLDSAGHLLGLINTVLDIAKVEAGRMEVHRAAIDPARLLSECAGTVQPLLREGVSLRIEAAPLPTLYSDAGKLRQILLNLLSNAAKFTHAGEIVLAARVQEQQLQLSVRDTGIGMSAEQLERVFEEFQQADSSTTREYGGSGLGLAISRRLAQLLHAELSADSSPGRGALFTLSLPLDANDAAEVSPTSPR